MRNVTAMSLMLNVCTGVRADPLAARRLYVCNDIVSCIYILCEAHSCVSVCVHIIFVYKSEHYSYTCTVAPT